MAPAMSAHSQAVVVSLGLLVLQFNLLVSTNESAVRQGPRLGFAVDDRPAQAFRHRRLGLVNTPALFKALAEAG